MGKDEGKCETCGNPTRVGKDGKQQKLCWDCYKKANPLPPRTTQGKQETLPEKSAQEEAADIHMVFKTFLTLLKEAEPKITPELAYATALGLTTQFWSNHRTPGGVR